jgi:flagellar motility protein MotE (MotC chaperone)
MTRYQTAVVPIALLLALAASTASHGENAPQPPPAAAADASVEEVARYCQNIAEPARERRYALQQEELLALKSELDQQVALLEAKRAELEDWVKRREAFAAQAGASVVEVYTKMRPDAAAARLEKLDPQLAAALLLQLSARNAAAVLNEMTVDSASLLTSIMAASADKSDG